MLPEVRVPQFEIVLHTPVPPLMLPNTKLVALLVTAPRPVALSRILAPPVLLLLPIFIAVPMALFLKVKVLKVLNVGVPVKVNESVARVILPLLAL
jgi:hypothetical protein